MTNRITLALTGLLAATALAAPAQAASLFFDFDQAASSITVTENSRLCFPSSGCALTAGLATLNDVTLSEGQSSTLDFANFFVTPGLGGDTNARVEAVLAFTSPLVGSASTGGTASYLRIGGLITGGALVWDNPTQQFSTLDGSIFTVKFNNLAGVTFGGDATSTVTITANNVVPEPATWAMMIAGFGMIGYAMRRRQHTTVRFA